MKQKVALIAAVALCLALCGCGEKTPVSPDTTAAPAPAQTAAPIETPAPTEAPAPVETPAVTEAPAEDGFPLAVPMGESRSVDLNGDGLPEEICVSIVPDGDNIDAFKITLNGEDVSDVLYRDYWVDFPEDSFWFITDVYSVDNLLEIAVQDWGPSDDPHTMFLRYEMDEVYAFGDVPGMIRSGDRAGDITFETDGFVRTDGFRLSVLQTWFAAADYEIGNAGWLSPVPREFYEANTSTPVTVKMPLADYNSAGDADHDTLEPGTTLTLLSTDNAEWVLADTGRGTVWLHLNPENPFEIETDTGYISGGDALEGLCFAD